MSDDKEKKEPEKKKEEGGRKYFHKPLMFSRRNPRTVKLVKKLPKKFPIFQEDQQVNSKILSHFLFNCLDYIDANHAEGVIRLVGNQLTYNDMIHKIENGFPCNRVFLEQPKDIHVVCELVKYYMREIPTPILNMFHEELIVYHEDDITLKRVGKILKDSFEDFRKYLIVRFFSSLRRIADNVKVTRMGPYALGICLCPSLFTRDVVALVKTKGRKARAQELIELLINNIDELEKDLFPKKDDPYNKDPKKAFEEALTKKKKMMQNFMTDFDQSED